MAGFPLLMLRIGKSASLTILLLTTTVALCAEIARARSPRFEDLIIRVFGAMMRRDERASDGRVKINGATWVLISLTLLTLVFELRVAAAAFMMFMIADAAAALVGTTFGKHEWPWSSRTLEGSAAFGLCSFLIGMLFGGFVTQTIALATVLGMVTESLPGPLNDNIRVPVCMALALMVDSYLM